MTSYKVADFDGTGGTLATSIDNYTLGSGSFTIQFLIRRDPTSGFATFPWMFFTTGGNINFFEISIPAQQFDWDSHGAGSSTISDSHWGFYVFSYDSSTSTASTLAADVSDVIDNNNINLANYSVNLSMSVPLGPFTSNTNPFTLGNNFGTSFVGRFFGGAAYSTAHATDDSTVKADILNIINSTVSADSIYIFNAEDGSHITDYETGHNLGLAGGITFPSIDVAIPILVTTTDTATAIDSINVNVISLVTIADSTLAIDSISVFGNKAYITISDFAYAEDNISINRGATAICGMTSGAYPLSPMEKDYINLSYQQIIDISGLPITYRIATIIGTDKYEHPIITYTNKTITAFVTILGNDEYEYVEPGFLPNHYAVMWVYCITPQVGDHIVWQGIEWEVRNSIPKVIGGDTVYYQTILRRVLARVPLTGEIGDGTNLGDTTGTGGTLTSGGVQYPPEGDP